jgi:hypothetical protein
MPQKTNLNVSPYFDDFDPDKNYHKVLFKPGYPIQARELTTLQSILQNQIEQQGNHLFKEGSVVIPGFVRVDSPIYAVEIESTYTGTPVSLYFENLLGKKLRGSVSGVLAEVVYTLNENDSERNNFTLYVKYIENGGVNFENTQFSDGETLLLQSPLTYGNLGFTVSEGEGICNTITSNSNSLGSSAIVTSGVYFVRGHFVKVKEQRIILDQYSAFPSYKIGFDIIESIVSADEDKTLYDNAKGFSNYTAPGADRFKIELILSKKELDDSNVDNFIEVVRVDDGAETYKKENTQYNLIRDELARRTYDESGDYYIKPFNISVRDCLNDRVRTDGLYYDNQLTASGITPSDDLLVYSIGPGKAYVNGYDVEKLSSSELVEEKPRTTKTVEDEVIRYDAGTSLILNRGYGAPVVGLGTTAYVSLRDSRIGVSSHVASGTEIGIARVYDFIPETDYVDNKSRLNLRLFDIETFTSIGLSTSISSLSTPAFIKGKKSKASGYLKESITNSRILKLYGVSGSFLENEPIIINGIDNGRLINEVIDYNINDVKSIHSTIGISTFNADVILSQKSLIAPSGTQFTITARSGGISTVSAGLDVLFTNILKSGDIVSYASTILSGDVIYNKVNSVASDGLSFTISGITTVSSICDGKLPSSSIEVNNIIKLNGLSDSSNSSLMTKLRFDNISNVNLENQEILQRRVFNNESFSGSFIRLTITDPDLFFASFDEDRFVITYSDGSIEPMRFDKYDLDTTGKILTFYGLTKTSGTANIITTVRNVKPNFKQKTLNTASTLVVSNSQLVASGVGTTTLNDGLTYSSVYGTRVQDEEICLNVPDVIRVISIYESVDTSDPQLPKIQLTGFTGSSNSNQDFIIGEQILGKTSGAVAIIIGRVSTDSLEYVYLNTKQFSLEEVVIGDKSLVSATITTKIITSSKDISQDFYLDDGQRDTYYDYARLIRKENALEPQGKLKIVFQNYTIDSGDTGELIAVNSYSSGSFKYDIPLFKNRRVSDYIDIRPRVLPFVLTANSKSPFEFSSRNFGGEGQYSRYTLCPDENIIISYSYYLPRIDVLYLKQDGAFDIVNGIPNESPTTPEIPTNVFEIAKITLPPYLYNIKNIKIEYVEHKRYRMSDISLLESRIARLEEYTSLSMLESKTENYSIKDPVTGLDRFKSGFFVDNFNSHEYHDLENPLFRCCVDFSTNTLRPLHYTTSLDLELGTEVISNFTDTSSIGADRSFPTDLGSDQVKKTGELITLSYENILYDSQTLASTTENVVPYLVGYWEGTIDLYPTFDNWIQEKVIVSETIQNSVSTQSVVSSDDLPLNILPPSSNAGITPFDWIANAKDILTDNLLTKTKTIKVKGSKQKQSIIVSIYNRKLKVGSRYSKGTVELISKDLVDRKLSNGIVNGDTIHLEWRRGSKSIFRPRTKNGISYADLVKQLVPSDVAEDFITKISTKRSRGQSKIVSLDYTPSGGQGGQDDSGGNSGGGIDVPDVIIDDDQTGVDPTTDVVNYLRSRNIEFDVKKLKPRTKFLPFFGNIEISNYITPKLLEVQMVSGSFIIGETVTSDPLFTTAKISFRLCTPNHKIGPYNSPQETYKFIPYTQTPPETTYSGSSTILNVDTRSLQLPTEVQFFGSVSVGMRLIGKESGAVAVVNNIRLVSDSSGRLIGSFFIPDPTSPGNPKWLDEENTFKVVGTTLSNDTNNNINSVSLEDLEDNTDSSAETDFNYLDVAEIGIISTRPPQIDTPNPDADPTDDNEEEEDEGDENYRPSRPGRSSTRKIIRRRPATRRQTVYYNIGDAFLGKLAVDRLFALGKASGVPNTLLSRLEAKGPGDYSQGRPGSPLERQIVNLINDSSFARNNNIIVSVLQTGLRRSDVTSLTLSPGVTVFRLPTSGRPNSDEDNNENTPGIVRRRRRSVSRRRRRGAARRRGSSNSIRRSCRKDPLAQSFFVDDETGVFLTAVDVFFETKDDDIPVTLQLRTMNAGVPSNVIIPFSEVTLNPEFVGISSDGSEPTRFEFPSPVYLSGVQEQSVRTNDVPNSEYAIVLLSDSPNYRVFISRLSETDILSGTRISAQPTLGSLFKSQNGTTWNPSQLEDLKYNIYRASFSDEGIVRFFNPALGLGNDKLTVTSSNAFTPLSKKIIVGLGSVGFDAVNVVPGVILSQGSATGKLVGIAGSVSSTIISNVGVGYSIGTYNGISLETETGNGIGAVATIGVTQVGIATVTITSGGFGYQVGDSLKVPRIQNLGYGGRISVTSIGSSNAFIIDEVQGTFSSGITTINYINSSGITTYVGAGVTISSIYQDQYYDGLHMKVFHQNHGMHSSENYMRIEQFRPTLDEINSTLTSTFNNGDTTISVQSGIGFTQFEGKEVTASNPGYIIIGNEIFKYQGVTDNTLTGVNYQESFTNNGISIGALPFYSTNTLVFKYEFNGVSIRRINKIHNFTEVEGPHPIDLNNYYIKIDTSDTDFEGTGIGSDRSGDLYFKKTIQSGRPGTVLTNNIQYEILAPKVNSIVPSGTEMTSRIRTFTGTSISGNEKSFVDAGYQDLPLNGRLFFQSPRIICSDVNEKRYITESPQRKSFSMDIVMSTTDERVSPVIDINPPPSLILTSNLLNNPVGLVTVSAYADDVNVRSFESDSHAAVYVSKPIQLAVPANSIKVLLSANKNETNDVRVLYQIFRVDQPNGDPNFELFPGYSNYNVDGIGRSIVDVSLSDGSSDFFVKEANDGVFKDYTYTADNLPLFNAFAIKIVMAGSNQASPPIVYQLRAIATKLPELD